MSECTEGHTEVRQMIFSGGTQTYSRIGFRWEWVKRLKTEVT